VVIAILITYLLPVCRFQFWITGGRLKQDMLSQQHVLALAIPWTLPNTLLACPL